MAPSISTRCAMRSAAGWGSAGLGQFGQHAPRLRLGLALQQLARRRRELP